MLFFGGNISTPIMMSALLYFRLWFQVLVILVNIIPFQTAVASAIFAAQHLHGVGHPV
jgi:hypothetical protein